MSNQTKTLKVVGEQRINCGGCENTVKTTLKQLSGVQQVEASRETQLIEVTFDAQLVTLETMRQELDSTGYQVEVA
jgi:copper chaperone